MKLSMVCIWVICIIINALLSSFGWYYGWNDVVYGMLNFYHPITWEASIILGFFPFVTNQIGICLLIVKAIMVTIISF